MRADVRQLTPAEQIPMLTGSRRLLEYEPIAKWEMQPATEPQLGALSRWGIDPATCKSKGHAAKLLDEVGFRYRAGFCSLKQVKILMRINEGRDPSARILQPWKLTASDASAIIKTDSMMKHVERLVA